MENLWAIYGKSMHNLWKIDYHHLLWENPTIHDLNGNVHQNSMGKTVQLP